MDKNLTNTETEEQSAQSMFASADYLNELTALEMDFDGLTEYLNESIKKFDNDNSQDEHFTNQLTEIKKGIDNLHSTILTTQEYYKNPA